MKKILSFLLAAALLSGIPAMADGVEPPAPDDLFELGEPSEYGEIALIEPETEAAPPEPVITIARARRARAAAVQTDGLASSYDPRQSGNLPDVRNQGKWDTCWAMAAIGAAEIDGLSNHLLSTSAAGTDLSERHLIYFFSHQADDPLGNSSGDYNTNAQFWITRGGNPVIATMTLANWHGVATEADTASQYVGLSESDSLNGAYAYTDALHLENTYTLDISTAAGRSALKSMLLEHGGAVLCLYYNSQYLFAGSPAARQAQETTDPDDDNTDPNESGDPDPADDPASDGNIQPAEPDGADGSVTAETAQNAADDAASPADDAPESTEAPADEEAESIEDDGTGDPSSVSGDFDDPEPVAGLDGDEVDDDVTAENPDAADFTVCYYQNVRTDTSHEVVIVGWDDDYPAENFGYSSAAAIPPANGAWLCRNSYGDSWAGGDGYFWVSYYDASAAAATGGNIGARVTVFDFASKDNYDNNYEYDGAVVLGYVNDTVNGSGLSTLDAASAESSRSYANVFTAAANDAPRGTEALRAVSTYAYRANVPYTAQVYTGLKDESDPTSGTLAATVEGTFTYAGFHTVELPESVTLVQGESFSVVFRVRPAADNSILIPACNTSASWYSTNDSEAGQSFVSMDGDEWLDCADLKGSPNVRIKAYTDDQNAVFPFADVPESAWYYGDVQASWLKYLVEGMTTTSFSPNSQATRAQIVAVLHRLAGNAAPTTEKTAFDDVSSAAWYYNDVLWAEDTKLITGSDDDGDGVFSFRPNDTITRQEFMTLLYRYAVQRGIDVSKTTELTAFGDSASVSSWAKDAVVWSVASGLQKGSYSESTGYLLLPQGRVTRAQLAAFLNRFSDML